MNEPVYGSMLEPEKKNPTSNVLKIILGIVVVLFVGAVSFAGGFATAEFLPSLGQSHNAPIISTPSGDQQSATPQEMQTLFVPFWQVWNIVHNQYVDQPVDDTKLMQGAINGMMQTLTTGRNYYYDPKQLEEATAELNGKDYEGIGAYVDTRGDYLVIINPIKGSPAEKAGLLPGDQIIAIDGTDMTGVDPEQARQKVLGADGTKVVLTIFRKGTDKPFDVTITRAKINTPLVEYEMRKDGIAYIRLNTFGETSDQELRKAVQEMLAKNPKGLILDLRYNPGGYLDQGIAVASAFLPADKLVVSEKFGDGKTDTHNSLGNGIATDIPMVVLINEGSASASEIVAGALQDYGRAILVGTKSYGKGSVQNFIVLDDNQGAVGVTIAKWLTPKGHMIDKIGLMPDIVVEMTENDYTSGLDPQLDAAVETLLAIIGGQPIPTSMPTPTTPATAP